MYAVVFLLVQATKRIDNLSYFIVIMCELHLEVTLMKLGWSYFFHWHTSVICLKQLKNNWHCFVFGYFYDWKKA